MLSHSPMITTDGLVLCLDAANPRSYPGSGSTWSDVSKNGNYAILRNGASFNTASKGQFSFDGTNDYADVGNGLMNSEYLSISVWIKPQTGGANNTQGLVTNGWTSTGRRDFNLTDGKWQFIQYDYTLGRLDILNAVDYNAWQNIVATSTTSGSDTISKIYKNGILMGSHTYVGRTMDSGIYGWSNCYIAYLNSSRFFCGSMASVYIYNRTLSANEVQRNYLATKSRFGL